MKMICWKTLHIVFFSSALLYAASCHAFAAPRLLHHELHLQINPQANELFAWDIMKIKTDGSRSLAFNLGANAQVKSIHLHRAPEPSISISQEWGDYYENQPKRILKFRFEKGKLYVSLPEQLNGSEVMLGLAYEATYADAAPENALNTEDPGYGVSGTISPKGTFLLAEAGWYPCIDGSFPTFRIHIKGPEGMEAVTAGKLVHRENGRGFTTSTWEITQPLRSIALSAGNYVVKKLSANGIPIYTYFFPDSQTLADVYLTAAADYIRLYSELIGPYPFPKFAVVENFFPTGYGFPSYTLLGSSVIRLPFIVKTSLGHEVAHSWFGNCLYVDYRSGNWSEGLTTYIADYFYQERSSVEEAKEYREQILRDYATLVTPDKDFPLADFVGRDSPATRAVGYGKAAMVFHMVRRLIGDEAFGQGLKTVYRENPFKTVGWSDFAEVFGRCREPHLRPFFQQWTQRSGAPSIALDEVELQQSGDQWQVTGELVQTKPYYTLQVPVRLESENAATESFIELNKAKASFKIVSNEPPKKLVVDPDADLFRRLYREEIPPTVNSIRGSTSLLAVLSEELSPEVFQASETLLQSLGMGRTPILEESGMTRFTMQDHDVLFIGAPRNRSLLPPLPGGLEVSPGQFTVDGVHYDTDSDVLFAVVPSRRKHHRTAAIFLPLSEQAAQTAVRKIPHYGKYSVLVFRQGANQVKTTWQPEISPLIHSFNIRKDKP